MSPVRAFYYTYVLQNGEGRWYIGCTSDLRKRLEEHNGGRSPYTKTRGPYELIYYEACLNKRDAFQREKYLKSGMGRRYLKNRNKIFAAEALTG